MSVSPSSSNSSRKSSITGKQTTHTAASASTASTPKKLQYVKSIHPEIHLLRRKAEEVKAIKMGYYPNRKPSVQKLFSISLANLEKDEVPKLPVPELEDTINEYLKNLRVIISESQYKIVEKMAKNFIAEDGLGQILQRHLMRQRHFRDNWAYSWWLNDMYLENSMSLPINSNPGMVLPPREIEMSCVFDVEEMAKLGAKIVLAALEFKNTIDEDRLPVEYAISGDKKHPLCMAQYKRLFTSYRVPGICRDDLITTELEYTKLNPHISVICNNQLYIVRLTKDKQTDVYITEQRLTAHLWNILDENLNMKHKVLPIGILTAQNRNIWAECRKKLLKDDENRKNLFLIETSILILCFDFANLGSKFNIKQPISEKYFRTFTRDETNMLHQMIHGGGSAFNSGNRWFDKTIQFIVSPDGVNGVCYEHSPAEGIAVIQAIEFILSKCEQCSTGFSNECNDPEQTENDTEDNCSQKLEWYLGNRLKTQIRKAMQFVDEIVANFDVYVFRFSKYGKEYMKNRRVSPDGYVQLALQLTYYRIHGTLTATYESASTRRFLLGRVDCIRSATIEALNWVRAMGAEFLPNDFKIAAESAHEISTERDFRTVEALFRSAMNKQAKVTKNNIFGYGIDVHLLALQQIAKQNSVTVDMFQHKSFKQANHFALSTSQVTTKDNSFMGYGAVVEDGYGASYNIKPDSVTFCLSSFNSDETTDTIKFAKCLNESLMMMKLMLNYSV